MNAYSERIGPARSGRRKVVDMSVSPDGRPAMSMAAHVEGDSPLRENLDATSNMICDAIAVAVAA